MNNVESFSLRFLFEKDRFRAILRNTLETRSIVVKIKKTQESTPIHSSCRSTDRGNYSVTDIVQQLCHSSNFKKLASCNDIHRDNDKNRRPVPSICTTTLVQLGSVCLWGFLQPSYYSTMDKNTVFKCKRNGLERRLDAYGG